MGKWRLERKAIENDPFGKTIPRWARHLAIGGFREKGWVAYDQRQNGKVIATGKWGDCLFPLKHDGIGCTQYPNGMEHGE